MNRPDMGLEKQRLPSYQTFLIDEALSAKPGPARAKKPTNNMFVLVAL
jgi:hypothetical protein